MPRIVDPIAATNTPLVRISSGKKNGKEYSVATNDREISAEMTRYLASLGHSQIAFITGHKNHKAVSHRFRGYKNGLVQSGLKLSEQLVVAGDNSIGSGEACAEQLLRRKRRPTAIYAANDDMAAGVIRVADRLGIKVPAQLSATGCNDSPLARQIYPALTTIRQPLAAMAERATLGLIDNARNGSSRQVIEFVAASLQIRESTDPVPD